MIKRSLIIILLCFCGLIPSTAIAGQNNSGKKILGQQGNVLHIEHDDVGAKALRDSIHNYAS